MPIPGPALQDSISAMNVMEVSTKLAHVRRKHQARTPLTPQDLQTLGQCRPPPHHPTPPRPPPPQRSSNLQSSAHPPSAALMHGTGHSLLHRAGRCLCAKLPPPSLPPALPRILDLCLPPSLSPSLHPTYSISVYLVQLSLPVAQECISLLKGLWKTAARSKREPTLATVRLPSHALSCPRSHPRPRARE